MRAGPLSNPKIIDRLNRDFVNCWILRKDLITLARDGTGDVGQFAALAKKHYSYPVDNQVFSFDGEFLSHVAANNADSHSIAGFHRMLDTAKPRK